VDKYYPVISLLTSLFPMIFGLELIIHNDFKYLHFINISGTSVAFKQAKQAHRLQSTKRKEQERRKQMKKLTIVFVAVSITAALATTTFAYGWGGGWGRGQGRGACDGGPGYERALKAVPELGLTAEQTAKIKDLREAHLKDIKPLRDKMFSKRGEMRLLWLQKTPDRDKISAMQKEISGLRDQMQEKMTAHRLAMFNVLTPEQQTKMQAGLAGRGFGGGRCAGGSGFGPGPGPGGFGPGSGR
jgi:Spy/CpxP family protein refolding chaperone